MKLKCSYVCTYISTYCHIPRVGCGNSITNPFAVKVSNFQNEFMKPLFLPKYEQKIVKISALTTQGRNPDNFFVRILEETMTSSIHSEIYRPL